MLFHEWGHFFDEIWFPTIICWSCSKWLYHTCCLSRCKTSTSFKNKLISDRLLQFPLPGTQLVVSPGIFFLQRLVFQSDSMNQSLQIIERKDLHSPIEASKRLLGWMCVCKTNKTHIQKELSEILNYFWIICCTLLRLVYKKKVLKNQFFGIIIILYMCSRDKMNEQKTKTENRLIRTITKSLLSNTGE